MLRAGQQSTFPKLLFISNRMKIERLLDQGLLLGDAGQQDLRHVILEREREGSMHLHGQALRTAAAELSSEDTEEQLGPSAGRFLKKVSRSPSVLQELKRQSGVFFDDIAVEGEEETGESEDDTAAANLSMMPKNGTGYGTTDPRSAEGR